MKKPKNLEALIEEATMDAYGEDEQRFGFLVMMQDNIPVPFPATLGDIEVQVVGFDGTQSRLLACCERNGMVGSLPIVVRRVKPPQCSRIRKDGATFHSWPSGSRMVTLRRFSFMMTPVTVRPLCWKETRSMRLNLANCFRSLAL